MSKARTKNRKQTSPSGGMPVLLETRIDPAHHHGEEQISRREPSSAELDGESAVEVPGEPTLEKPPPDLVEEQLRRQAEQLAEYLRTRQRELDHRESQLNAQLAQLESDARTARIWLAEREEEIQDREARQTTLEKEFRQRLHRLAMADAAIWRRAEANLGADHQSVVVEGQAGDLPCETEFQQAVSGISGQWAAQSQQLSSQAARQAKLAENIQAKEKRLELHAQELAEKRRDLEEAEQQAAQAKADAYRLREQLLDERQSHREEVRFQRQRMAADERQAIAELEKKRELLERRAEHVDQCRTALLQLRAELQRMHRETLEIRLVTEELWALLSGAAPPAALTRSLGRLRTQLADQYRMANAELLEQKKELESIRGQLAAQYEKLIEQRGQFERWATGQQQQAEQQAARLIAREQEVEDAESQYAEQSRRWQIERREYEQEIRQLRLQLAPREGSMKVA